MRNTRNNLIILGQVFLIREGRTATCGGAGLGPIFFKEGLTMAEIKQIKEEQERLEHDAVIAIEKIKTIGNFFNWIEEKDFYVDQFGEFVRNMGEVIEAEIKKIGAYVQV